MRSLIYILRPGFHSQPSHFNIHHNLTLQQILLSGLFVMNTDTAFSFNLMICIAFCISFGELLKSKMDLFTVGVFQKNQASLSRECKVLNTHKRWQLPSADFSHALELCAGVLMMW